MSLILDALNRADEERSQEHSAPRLHSNHSYAAEPEKPIRRWLIEGAIILLVIAAVAYHHFSQRDAEPKQNLATKTVAAATAPTAVQSTVETTVEATAELARIQNRNTSIVATATENTATDGATQTESHQAHVPRTEIPSAKAATATNAAISSLYQHKNQKPVDSDKSPGTEQTRKTIAAAQPINNTQAILQKIPLLPQMSQRFQSTIPTIDYTVHVYSDSENAGFVNLNGSIRKIGSKITPELIVIAILKDSVVLDYKGTQFRLLALNSWVNF